MSDMQCHVTELRSQQQVSDCFDMMVQSQVKWEKFLMPAPTSVAILGELVHLATRMKGFTLNQGSAGRKSPFKRPDSFQRCLMEVCNQTIKSFKETRTNLNKIRMCCEDLLVHVKNVGEGSSLSKDLPRQLENIQVCADKSKTCAESVEKELSNLSELLSELLETCAASQSISQDKMGEVRKLLSETKQKSESVEKEKNNLQKQWIEASQKREEVTSEYNSVRASALIDQFCLEGLKQMKELLPKIVDLLSNVTSPVLLAVELGKGLMFLIKLVSELKGKESSESDSEVSSFLRKVREEAEKLIKEVQSQLEESQNKYNECHQNMKSLCDESETLLREIKKNQAQEMDVSTSVELMAKGLGALGSIKSNWSEMINFIHIIPKLTEDCQKTFKRLGAGSGEGTQGAPGALASSQMINLQVSQAVRIMTLIGDMSKTYVEIHDKYLADQLGDLSSLLGGQGSEYKFKKLQEKCAKAREEIHRRAAVNQEQLQKNVQQGSEAIASLTDQLQPRK